MSIYPSEIFRAYDIRGVYPDKLNEATAYAVGQLMADLVPKKKKTIIVGQDMRLSSPSLSQALIKGINSRGVNVEDIGLVPVEVLYFAFSKNKARCGGAVIVTASHNPQEYNGFKILDANGEWVSGEKINKIISRYPKSVVKKFGQVKKIAVIPAFWQFLKSIIKIKKLKPLKLVIDTGNGMAGTIIPLLKRDYPGKIIPLFTKLDGSFPNHPSNPLLPCSTEILKKRVIKEKADFGVTFDGDADRMFLIDEQGQLIQADITLLILANYLLNKHPRSKIIYTISCSQVVPEKIKFWGGQSILSRVGYSYVGRLMRKKKAILGGEISGHFLFAQNDYSGLSFLALLIVLQVLSKLNKPLSELVADLSPYFKTPEINFVVSNKQKIIKQISKYFKGGKKKRLDGLTIYFSNWWFNLRPSNTEPCLRLVVEAKTKKLMLAKKAELIKLIKRLDSEFKYYH